MQVIILMLTDRYKFPWRLCPVQCWLSPTASGKLSSRGQGAICEKSRGGRFVYFVPTREEIIQQRQGYIDQKWGGNPGKSHPCYKEPDEEIVFFYQRSL